MVRTQIYLTEEERAGLHAVAKTTDRIQSEIIREAIDRFLDLTRRDRRTAILDEAAGMWKIGRAHV
jgi:predicted transcriptional regulator